MVQPIDKRLDMVLTIATPVDSYVLSTIVKDNPVPINVFMNHGEIHVTFFDVTTRSNLCTAPDLPVNFASAAHVNSLSSSNSSATL